MKCKNPAKKSPWLNAPSGGNFFPSEYSRQTFLQQNFWQKYLVLNGLPARSSNYPRIRCSRGRWGPARTRGRQSRTQFGLELLHPSAKSGRREPTLGAQKPGPGSRVAAGSPHWALRSPGLAPALMAFHVRLFHFLNSKDMMNSDSAQTSGILAILSPTPWRSGCPTDLGRKQRELLDTLMVFRSPDSATDLVFHMRQSLLQSNALNMLVYNRTKTSDSIY